MKDLRTEPKPNEMNKDCETMLYFRFTSSHQYEVEIRRRAQAGASGIDGVAAAGGFVDEDMQVLLKPSLLVSKCCTAIGMEAVNVSDAPQSNVPF